MHKYLILFLLFLSSYVYGQKPKFEFHSYGRVGVSSSVYEEKVGSRLNLSHQGALGGRHEENDYIEMTVVANIEEIFKIEKDKPNIRFVLTTQSFSGNNTFIANNTVINFAEMYLEVYDTLFNIPVSMWVGSRYYRDKNIDMADYWTFNNLTGQGFGFQYGNTKIALVSSLVLQDQPGNPYGDELYDDGRQKHILALQHQIDINENNSLHLLAEYHFTGKDSLKDPVFIKDRVSDYGVLGGVMHRYQKGDFINNSSIRYGSRIANGPGDDGWSSRSFINFGNPNQTGQFNGAYGVNFTENFVWDVNDKWGIMGYAVYRYAIGASAPVFVGTTRPNEKWDLSVGVRPQVFLTDKIQLMFEYHYQMRDYQEFTNGIVGFDPGLGVMNKFTIAPVYVPTRERSLMARPHIRFVYSLAFYNDVVKQNGLSQFYEAGNKGDFGQYIGLKSEWWF
ncbi:carbohydrate porin [Flammeovirga yaeyamensis]|uniref:Carbohydrate porin n=1 Tax=Flammeovirga yaeyamensis TaxID=367791 RepID=A0AAX1N339_9BACT|nr:carbohydrate porin [Flammeovirga yaeyamensis]MBB3695997.1 maltoporin [Flammeovirga yaeyamensis]NMF34683.1 carbohydrate porin [Flammeovirga yaeyamensis]QWG00487.1 carbohydrate porin [Flammeovirga yaeyamensis]